MYVIMKLVRLITNYGKNIANNNYKVYPVYYTIGNGMMNIDKAIEDLDYIIRTNLKSQKDMLKMEVYL